jgi:peptide/nickel transport system permease protein
MNYVDKESPVIKEWSLTWFMLRKSKIAMLSMGVLGFVMIVAILAPWISPYPPSEMHLGDKFLPPTIKYPLGTDSMGRDTLSRILYGARASVFASIAVVALSVAIGVPIGAISGFLGGKTDEVLMRFTDIIMSFPGVTLAMLLAYAMGRGIFSAALALGLVGWTSAARIVRSVVLSERETDYVTAARVLGKNDLQILFGEVLPNCLYPIIVDVMIRMGTTIIALAGLSFIGVAVQPPDPDLGVAVSEGRLYIADYPWLSMFPGVLILAIVLAYNMIGDRLRDALDPKLRREIIGAV